MSGGVIVAWCGEEAASSTPFGVAAAHFTRHLILRIGSGAPPPA